MATSSEDMLRALEEFVYCIDVTGGLMRDEEEFDVPVADPEWVDLGYAYLMAVQVLQDAGRREEGPLFESVAG